MKSSSLTSKGQVTIPVDVRKILDLHPGDRVGFVVKDGQVRLLRKENNIEAAFGLCKAEVSVTPEDMTATIRKRAAKRHDRD